MLKKEELSYYSSTHADRLFKELDTSQNGLSHYAAEKRLKEFGRNTLAKKKKKHPVFRFLSHFKNPLIIILLAASIILFAVKDTLDASIIIAIVLVGVILDFFQEFNAGKAAEKLKESIKTTATVIRDGKKTEINIENICMGDVIELDAGSLVPADARVISSKELFVNQSALTGESLPSEKFEKTMKKSASLDLSDMDNMVFMGTSVVSGTGLALVVKTGLDTEFGKISGQLAKQPPQTEFEKGLASFSYLILKFTVLLVLFIFLFNSVMKHDILQSFMFSVAVAVGLTPELLPMIMSVNMAKGSLGMAKKGAIVKNLSSIPNFGSMDVLCTDKTGTLTEDRIRLVKYVDILGKNSKKVLECAYVNSSFHTGIANPLDSAVLNFKKIPISSYEKIDEMPFDFVRRKMSVVIRKAGKNSIFTKGSPEDILNSSSAYEINGRKFRLDAKAIEKITAQYHDMSRQGYRVLAVAYKDIKHKKNYTKNDEFNLTLLGFVAFFDPPKKGVKKILAELDRAGIEIKIITGDNELVTKKICADIGLHVKGVLLGSEIKKLTDDALKVRVEETTIFAKFTPDQKNRIIYALKSNGHAVGYMGDGINDAPSMNTADIGISVESAVDVAKESASIILTHKSLEVLKEGVMEGRKTFGNTIKYIMMGLSSNFGNMFSVLGAVLFLPFLPMLPVQILLNNLLYDFSQITIPSDNVDKEFIQKPKRWNMGFIKKFMFTFGPVSSLFDFITFFILFSVFSAPAAIFQTGWFMESLATQTLVIHIIRTKQTPFLKSRSSRLLLISTVLCVAAGWTLPYTKLGQLFGFAPLPLNIVLILAGLVIFYLIIVEIVKKQFYMKYDL
jgi:Mg2+-importing ATPase